MRRSDIRSRIIPLGLNYIYPSSCPSCHQPTDNLFYTPFCRACWDCMIKYSGPSCGICSTPLVSDYADHCQHCLENPPHYKKAASFALYDGTLAAAIHHFKFLGIRMLSEPLSELLLYYDSSGIDAVMPVPLTPKGLRNRGFNQALLLAHHFAKKKKIPLMMDILYKATDTPPQIGLSAKERVANVKKTFTCTAKTAALNILLIDDVMTTGATVNACALQLLRAGAASVQVLTLARAGMI